MNKLTLDWNHYTAVARQISADGCVLLENNHDALPFTTGTRLAVFGRIQSHYYKSGIGSGGLVNVDRVVSISDALTESGCVTLDDQLADVYRTWEHDNPFEEGVGWGQEPWSQKEMPVTQELVDQASKRNDAALVIIGRCAGEDKDNKAESGSFLLSREENNLLATVRAAFKKMVVVLNVGNIIDMTFVDTVKPDAVLYAWQGGMIGGYGVSDVLTGAVNPSGKLSDTVAYSIHDYPSDRNFGDPKRNVYQEDIFVGYRYFETAAQKAVRYPFGFGRSYTTFTVKNESCCTESVTGETLPVVSVRVTVTNTGSRAGREVVQLYAAQPQGKLGKPARVLAAFAKTRLLAPGEAETLLLTTNLSALASFDDTGCTGHRDCMILEAGHYVFFTGTDVRCTAEVGSYTLTEDVVTEQLHEAMPPVRGFSRLKAVEENGAIILKTEEVRASAPVQQKHRNEALSDVQEKYSLSSNASVLENRAILSKLTDTDLACLIRGEGMGSPKVTPGTAGAFGGVTSSLKAAGIPCACCTDGPSGLRLDSGARAFSFPIGTMQACTFDPPLIEELLYCTGLEMASINVDILLGPGINIHRHPLNGRNFEYFSEDPYVTGVFAAAIIRGLHKAGVTGSLKHFCANNQEWHRHETDSVVSCRALREIYLKGFEMAVKQADADVVMTSYGAVNGLWTAGSYDLTTLILRDEWGFKGIVMSDWWAVANDEGKKPFVGNLGASVRSQNDLYMVCSDVEHLPKGDNTLESLANGTVDRAELLRVADNVLSFIFKSRAADRSKDPVTVINRPSSPGETAIGDVIYYDLDKELTVPFETEPRKKGSSYTFALNSLQSPAVFRISFTAKADGGSLAQVPVSIAANGIHVATLTWNGTDGEWCTLTQELPLYSRYIVLKMYFAQSGLTLRNAEFSFVRSIYHKQDI